MRRMAIVITIALAPATAAASKPQPRLMPEVCESEQRPAITSLAVPGPVRSASRRIELSDRAQPAQRRKRSMATGWIVVAAAVVIGSAAVLMESR